MTAFSIKETCLGSIDRKFKSIYAESLCEGITATTPAAGDNSNKIATTAYTKGEVNTAVNNLVDSAPEALDTLKELANALGNDANFINTMNAALSAKADNNKLSMPSNSYIELGTDITSYTAPSDGYLVIEVSKPTRNSASYCTITAADVTNTVVRPKELTNPVSINCPIAAGVTANIALNNCSITKALFVYTESSM